MSNVGNWDTIDDIAKDCRIVLKSLINKDGYYKNSDAKEIHNGFGKQMNWIKLQLEAVKIAKIPEALELAKKSFGKL